MTAKSINQSNQDKLTFSTSELPPGVTIDTDTGLITGRLDSSTRGDYVITITISDGTTSTDVTFTWNVTGSDDGADVEYF